jgi:hypothetical protein
MFDWIKNLFKIDIPDVSSHIAEEPKIANFKTGAIKSVSVTTPGTGYTSGSVQASPTRVWASTSPPANYTIGATHAANGVFTVGAGGGGGGSASASYAGYSYGNLPPSGCPNNGYTFQSTPTSIISISGASNKELVRLNSDGTVVWATGVEVDEAAKTFANMMSLSAEMAAGITQSMKLRMRDSVFEDLINIAKEKGSLSADDLTYLLEASKIVEKLRGPKDDKK